MSPEIKTLAQIIGSMFVIMGMGFAVLSESIKDERTVKNLLNR